MLGEYATVADPSDPAQAAHWYNELIPALKDHPRIHAVSSSSTIARAGGPEWARTAPVAPSVGAARLADAALDPYVNPPLPP